MRGLPSPPHRIEDVVSGEVIDVDKTESDAFWAWASIETLRHTGVRVEELLEISHLGVGLLHGSRHGRVGADVADRAVEKPRGASVAGQSGTGQCAGLDDHTSARPERGGTVPLSARYDPHERVAGPPLPHLFQHRMGWKWVVPATTTVQTWLTQTVARSGLTDATGSPPHYTPHDFRRMFATEAVTGGLPVHIVGRLLGAQEPQHHSATWRCSTTSWSAPTVRFSMLVVLCARSLNIANPPTRSGKTSSSISSCANSNSVPVAAPYGTPCKHEHACLRCPSLRVDPRARRRLVEIIANLRDRIEEAQVNGWTGEVEGLRVSLKAAAAKLVSVDRMQQRSSTRAASPVDLGIPVLNS